MFSSWWSVSEIFLCIFWVGWGGQQIFKAILRWWYYRFDRSSYRIKLILSVKNDTCCAVWPSHKSFNTPLLKKVMKNCHFKDFGDAYDSWVLIRNSKCEYESLKIMFMIVVCVVLLVGHSCRLAVANTSFHHQQHLVFVAHLLWFSRHRNRLVQTLWTINCKFNLIAMTWVGLCKNCSDSEVPCCCRSSSSVEV